MSLQEIKPMLYTRNVEQTVNFYTNSLGFKCTNFMDDWSWAAVARDDIEIMVASPNEHIPFDKPLFTGSFYILTNAVQDLWDEIKEGVSICYPLETFDYGMSEFAVYDNNGYMLQFGQPVD